jgi:hypothetical protein
MDSDNLKDLPTLETPRLILRKLRMDDAEDMFEYAQDRELGLNGLWLPYTQLQESIDDLAEAQELYAKGNFWDWAIEHRADHKMIGRRWSNTAGGTVQRARGGALPARSDAADTIDYSP